MYFSATHEILKKKSLKPYSQPICCGTGRLPIAYPFFKESYNHAAFQRPIKLPIAYPNYPKWVAYLNVIPSNPLNCILLSVNLFLHLLTSENSLSILGVNNVNDTGIKLCSAHHFSYSLYNRAVDS